MKTPYDFITILLFSGLVVLFLQRSVSTPRKGDSLWQYMAASVGLAVVNYLGNERLHLYAILLLAGVLAFIGFILRPLYPRR